mmetsp:Transcript_66657/g.134369  ORF Transcript_66657/g.134369 Transcript_66657/m.134369 type:complete len:264 (+) Transcript_66657:38-829(+)
MVLRLFFVSSVLVTAVGEVGAVAAVVTDVDGDSRKATEANPSFHAANSISFGEAFTALVHILAPKHIALFGIDQVSLKFLDASSDENCAIDAFDVFDSAGTAELSEHWAALDVSFKDRAHKITIKQGDFWDSAQLLADGAYDLIHVDIGNTGREFMFALDNLLDKLTDRGALLLEGGSQVRDMVSWMARENKEPIAPIVRRLQQQKEKEARLREQLNGLRVGGPLRSAGDGGIVDGSRSSSAVQIRVMGDNPCVTIVRRTRKR